MEKYLKIIEGLKKKFGENWIKPAMETVLDFAREDVRENLLSTDEYSQLCAIYGETVRPKSSHI